MLADFGFSALRFMVAVIIVLAIALARVLLLDFEVDLDAAFGTPSFIADETEMSVEISSVIFLLGHFSRSNQNRGSGTQSS